MSDYTELLYFILLAMGVFLLREFWDRLFYYKKYKKIRKEWSLLAQELNLDADIRANKNFIDWIRGFSLSTNIIQEHYLIKLFWRRSYKGTEGRFTCEIELQNSKEITFHLSKNTIENITKRNPFQNKQEVKFEDLYFKENFILRTNLADEMSVLFDDDIHKKTRKMFAIEINATLELKRRKKKDRGTEILDSRDQYFLVYTNDNYSINNRRERIFMTETIRSMIEIVKRVDEL